MIIAKNFNVNDKCSYRSLINWILYMPSEEFYVHLKTASGNYKCSVYPEPSATVAFKLIISKVFIHKNGEKVAYQTTYACT